MKVTLLYLTALSFLCVCLYVFVQTCVCMRLIFNIWLRSVPPLCRRPVKCATAIITPRKIAPVTYHPRAVRPPAQGCQGMPSDKGLDKNPEQGPLHA